VNAADDRKPALAAWIGPPVAGHSRGQGGATAPSFIYLLGRVDHGVRRQLAKRVARWDLSVAQFTTLSVLRARPGLSNAQLARRALSSPQSINGVLAELETRGLILRRADPDHRRILRTRLTTEGARIIRAAEAAVNALQEDLLDGVAPEAREAVVQALLRCMEHLRGR
jgi:DNA-binding MarR family transcriptional regulator